MFRKHYPLPDGSIEYGDKPDVILDGNRRIGIEITNFFLEPGVKSKSEQVQSRWREEVVLRAQNIYLSEGGKRIEFSFEFDKASPIKNKEKLANQIVALTKNNDGQRTGTISKEIAKQIPELSSVYLNANEYEDACWRVVQGHSVPLMQWDRLREIVSDKEAKSKHYRHCDAHWLVVVVDFIDPAQDQEIRTDILETIDSPIFEKLIVYKPHFGHVVEAK